jgi:hypothetical protein
MIFQYRITRPDGTLVTTCPTLKEAVKVADKYKGIVTREIYNATEKKEANK